MKDCNNESLKDTNLNKNFKDKENIINFLIDLHNYDFGPWTEWFDKKYCSKCEMIKSRVKELGDREHDVAFCELNGKCKFFEELGRLLEEKDVIEMWLESDCETVSEEDVDNV